MFVWPIHYNSLAILHTQTHTHTHTHISDWTVAGMVNDWFSEITGSIPFCWAMAEQSKRMILEFDTSKKGCPLSEKIKTKKCGWIPLTSSPGLHHVCFFCFGEFQFLCIYSQGFRELCHLLKFIEIFLAQDIKSSLPESEILGKTKQNKTKTHNIQFKITVGLFFPFSPILSFPHLLYFY